ncbi:MAG TPA: bifunctional phosphopantothenoylcysteine decarboxylase/phosphopantothenate--cysteine ligase CoaBC [Candidatus Limnocylindrales bacterium]|nr:bifunctional phosphopantothenoylcysteine decarboxylase/phosphopantothenate--cysteine ligase CoaBC [Candidatus Limnocylindrales bacterium]
MKKNIIVGVGSGIAAFKAVDLIKLLKEQNLDVFVIMTQNATQMIDSSEFEIASGNKVYVDLFEEGFDYHDVLKERKVEHIELADSADLMVIVPATANIIGQLAHGICSDFLTTTSLAMTAPIIICPSMNVNMWQNPLVQENVEQLKKVGYQIIEPTEGMLACGYTGPGRLEDVNMIAEEIMLQFKKGKSLKGKKIIITSGGTIEKIDEVRYLANRSSGKMGVALAEECYLRGAEVILLRAKGSVKPRYLIQERIFETLDDLFSILTDEIKNADIMFHAAAVSDFTAEKSVKGKISSEYEFDLKLKPTIKIVDQIKKINPKIKLIAFKAEYGLSDSEMIKKAQIKLTESDSDVVVVNDVSKSDRGFESDENEVIVVLKNGKFKKILFNSKREIAKGIVDAII